MTGATRPQEGSIEVRIDQLLLVGFDEADREEVGRAAQSELARLCEETLHKTWPAGSADLAVLRAGSFSIDPGMAPPEVGAEIGRAVFRRLAA